MPEATLDTTTASDENAKILEEMLRNAKPADVQGELERNPIINKGTDSDAPVPMVGRVISSDGKVWVYETQTHERAPALVNMLPQLLRQRRPDGSYRWTTIKPTEKPFRGTYKCMLHTESPNRAEYTRMGFRECPKSNLTSEYQVRLHMLKKHPQEWKAIDEAQKRAEAEEDRQLRRQLLQQTADQIRKDNPVKLPFVCDICGADFPTPKSLARHQLDHKED